MDAEHPDCWLCANVATAPERGWLFEGTNWAVTAAPIQPSQVAGNVFLQLRRHVAALEANEAEWAELGPLLRRVLSAVQTAAAAERVYFFAWGERNPHFHVVVSPRAKSVPPEHRGPSFLLNAATYHDPTQFAPIEARIRALLSVAG